MGLGLFLRKAYKKPMWIAVALWACLRVAMWITHVGGKFRHGLLEKSLTLTLSVPVPELTGSGPLPKIRFSIFPGFGPKKI